MKKTRNLLSLLLALVIACTFSVGVYAEKIGESKYEDEFEKYFALNVDNLFKYDYDREYKDCYEYFSESNNTKTPDWVLVYAFCGTIGKPGGPVAGAYAYTVCSDYFLEAFGFLSSPYEFAYYVYVPAENKIYTLNEAFDAQLENIDNTFTEYLLSNEYGAKLIGDCDKDKKLTILDATEIQRYLARLTWFDDSILNYHNVLYSEQLRYLSDVDRDGERTILDATLIQLKLAKLR